jgi:hypothetical protein
VSEFSVSSHEFDVVTDRKSLIFVPPLLLCYQTEVTCFVQCLLCLSDDVFSNLLMLFCYDLSLLLAEITQSI